jgi:hypothetical protein
MFALCLRAPNDRNGNPRRVWLIYAHELDAPNAGDRPTYVFDEGYGGRSALADDLARIDSNGNGYLPGRLRIHQTIAAAPVFDVPAAQYRAYAKGISHYA